MGGGGAAREAVAAAMAAEDPTEAEEGAEEGAAEERAEEEGAEEAAEEDEEQAQAAAGGWERRRPMAMQHSAPSAPGGVPARCWPRPTGAGRRGDRRRGAVQFSSLDLLTGTFSVVECKIRVVDTSPTCTRIIVG